MDLLEIHQSEKGKLFQQTADAQRGEPEQIMVAIQHYAGGGVFSFCVEHVGDLTHRMTEHFDFLKGQRGIVNNKVEKTLRVLTQGYGFGKEFDENLVSNFRYRKEHGDMDVENLQQFTNKVKNLAQDYADAHKRVPVWNDAQWHARQAAIDLGEYHFGLAIKHLRWLLELTENKDRYYEEVSKVDPRYE